MTCIVYWMAFFRAVVCFFGGVGGVFVESRSLEKRRIVRLGQSHSYSINTPRLRPSSVSVATN